MKIYITVYLIILKLAFSLDKSIDFDGVNDFIRIEDHPQLDLTSNYTIEAWIFPEQFLWLGGIVSKYHTNAANGYLLRLSDMSPYSGISFDEKRTQTGILSTNQWYHIAAVNEQGIRKLYVNGTEYGLTGTPLNVMINDNNLKIGSDYGGRYFNGRIDEVRLWNIPRSQEEIQATLDQNLSGNEQGLVAYYTFDEGSGDTLYDHSSNGHHGLLRGSPDWVDGHTLSGILGDINFDEVINIYDAVMLVSLMLGFEAGSPLQNYASDINQDGSVDIIDIITLIQMILELDITGRTILTQAGFVEKENVIHFTSDGEILGFEIKLIKDEDITYEGLPSGWNLYQKNDKIIGFSSNGSSLPSNFNLKISKENKIERVSFGGFGKNKVVATKSINPHSFKLKSGPNPFNPLCKISFHLNSDVNVKAQIYDIKGHLVYSLLDKNLKSGFHNYSWQPINCSSGTYFIRLSDGVNSQTNKILYLK